MARPDVSPSAEDLYASLGVWASEDEAQDWALLRVCDAIATAFIEPVAELVQEREGRVSWEVLFSPADCPVEYLGYLAMFTGVTLTDSMSEAEKRAAIALPEGWRRGSPAALIAAVKRTLTGAQTVLVDERYTGDAYQLRVRTLESETPSDAVSIAAVLTQKPVGVALTFDSVIGGDWLDYVGDEATWAAGVSDNATWDDVVARLP